MPLSMRYGLLCDHAAIGQNGKPIALHIFEYFLQAPEHLGMPLAPFSILARLECSIADGIEHTIVGRLVDEDGEVLAEWHMPPQPFVPQGPGLPLALTVSIQAGEFGLPRFGSYEIEFRSDNQEVGRIPFALRALTPPVST